MKSKKPRFAAKILALVLSLLTLLGAMPVAFAASLPMAPVEEWPTLAEDAEIIIGQKWKNFEFVGGKGGVPGHFEWMFPDQTAYVIKADGTASTAIKFVPDDTTSYRYSMKMITIKARKADNPKLEGTATATLEAGKPLSEAVITTSDDFGIRSYDTLFKTQITWETPDKIFDKSGTYTEKAIVTGLAASGSPLKDTSLDSFTTDINITVSGDYADVVEIKELPTASDITVGQKLGDSALTGGRVTKGGVDVAGTFAWKDPTITMTAQGTAKYDVIFTPDDSSVCEPIEMQVAVKVGYAVPEIIEWPAIKAEYKYGKKVHECITLEGGEANVPGYFRLKMDDAYYSKVPETINETVEVTVEFSAKDWSNYQTVTQKMTVKFEPADPDCFLTYVVANSKTYKFDCNVRTWANWPQHTGHFYIVVDDERTELTEYNNKVSYDCDNLAVGEHYVYAEYVPGENDVYRYGRSNNEFTINIEAFYNVTQTDFEGTRVVANRKAGQEVIVQAANHEKEYYDFSGWTVEGTPLPEGTDTTQQRMVFTMPDGEVHLTANYKLNFKLALKTFFNDLASWFMDAIAPIVEFIRGLIPQK